MIMAPAEIAAEYRQAKKPLLQIGILADLNTCSRKDIVEILRSEGCELPERYAHPEKWGRGSKAPKEPPIEWLPEEELKDHEIQIPREAGSLRKLKQFLRAVMILEELLEEMED